MQPTTVEALVIVALVLSPGYLFTQVARRIIAHVPESSDVRFLLTIITYGTAIHAVAYPFGTNTIVDHYLDGRLRSYASDAVQWATFICLVLPVGLGIIAGGLTLLPPVDWVLDKVGMGYIDRMPSAWDYVTRLHQGSWVRIHLKDDKGIIGGQFGRHSLASLDPRRPDIYLQSAWRVDADGNFGDPIPDTRGVWVGHDVIAYVHFLNRWEEPDGTEGSLDRQEFGDGVSGPVGHLEKGRHVRPLLRQGGS